MRIAIIGQQDFGKAVLEAFLQRGDVVAGVFCRAEKTGEKADALSDAARQHGLPLFQLPSLKSEAASQALRELDVDLGVMAYVLQFAPQEFVNLPRHGTIQYHPSLLPRYRGPSSINWPIARGDTETGLTIFRPTDGLDEGPVILQKRVPIGPDDTLGDVYFNQLFPQGVAAMLEAADLVVQGRHTETIQDEGRAHYVGWFREEESRIPWATHADQIYNMIRACNPAPGAWCEFAGTRIQVFDARKHPTRTFGSVRGAPGEIIALTDQGVQVSAQGGVIEILKVKPQGGKKIAAAEWARAAGLAVGQRFH